MSGYLDLLMFAALVIVILAGFPVAFGVAGIAIIFGYLGWSAGVMEIGMLGAISQRVFGLISNQVLIAIPLFILMGALLEKSRVAEELLERMGQAFGRFHGGLGVSVVLVGALLAASTGVVGATVVAMGLIALPAMLKAGYFPPLACGVVCTAGTLGQIIPPSTLLIILADVMSNSFQQAQYEQGLFVVQALSVGQFFAAALFPGLLLVGLYIAYILLRGIWRPADLPAAELSGGIPTRRELAASILPPALLIVAVLGSILGGIASPTEAAAVGGVGALILAGIRSSQQRRQILIGATALIVLAFLAGLFPVRMQRSDLNVWELLAGVVFVGLAVIGAFGIWRAVHSSWRTRVLHEAATSTMMMTAMIFATILAAGIFSLVFIGLGGEERVHGVLHSLPGGPTGALLFTMLVVFVLGFFLDFVEISVIVLPLVAPGLILLGHDPLWLGILLAINLQTSFLTPPFGFSLFYLRAAAPAEITTGQIYQGVIPFIGLQAVGVLLVWLYPAIATWLPNTVF